MTILLFRSFVNLRKTFSESREDIGEQEMPFFKSRFINYIQLYPHFTHASLNRHLKQRQLLYFTLESHTSPWYIFHESFTELSSKKYKKQIDISISSVRAIKIEII